MAINERERTYDGCYGQVVDHGMIAVFLKECFMLNNMAEESGQDKFPICIWGHPGIGKTAITKQFASTPVEFDGKTYPGYTVHDVPIAQFEEMGDLHGIPTDCVLMYKVVGKGEQSKREDQWVPQRDETIRAFREDGWKIDASAVCRTLMAPPDWVPTEPGPTILLLDDWNRASIRILKGIMQLLQNFGMVSWKLPRGCHIVLTGNPDEQDYLVTTIDEAIKTRIRHVTLREDEKQWSVWAERQQLDPRGISWVLYQPEMMIGKELTNPRTLSQFFMYTKTIGDLQNDDVRKRAMMYAHSLLDEETVAAFMVFCTREMENIVEPEDVLAGKKEAFEHMKKLMTRSEPRTDILGIVCQRLFAHIVSPHCDQNKDKVKNFQNFITQDWVPDDTRHTICRQLAADTSDSGRVQQWLLGHNELRKQVLDMLD